MRAVGKHHHGVGMVRPWNRPQDFMEPCLPSLGANPPAGPDWVHEIKHDGYRLIARREVVRSDPPRDARQIDAT
jgi:hypothetical protein